MTILCFGVRRLTTISQTFKNSKSNSILPADHMVVKRRSCVRGNYCTNLRTSYCSLEKICIETFKNHYSFEFLTSKAHHQFRSRTHHHVTHPNFWIIAGYYHSKYRYPTLVRTCTQIQNTQRCSNAIF